MTDLRKFFADVRQTGAKLIGSMPDPIAQIIEQETKHFNGTASVTRKNQIPETKKIPIEKPNHWLQIPDVIACFVDMAGSTRLSASVHQNSTAKIYRYFTQTAVRIFHEFEAPYIDVRGDGVFALFDQNQTHRALAATVSFKTFVANNFTPRVKASTKLEIGGHFGIDKQTVLVRKFGLKAFGGRSDRKNEVWAGRPINMAAKLASLSSEDTLLVSDRYWKGLTGHRSLMSCGCGSDSGQTAQLWSEIDVSADERFDFDVAHQLASNWCSKHGKDFCRSIIEYDI